MNITANYVKNNGAYKNNTTIRVKGLMLHSTATPQPKASVYQNNDNTLYVNSVAVHGYIDANTGDVIMCLPTALTDATHAKNKTCVLGWHSGTGSLGKPNNANNQGFIGIEMCESDAITYITPTTFSIKDKAKLDAHRTTAYKSAVLLFARLCDLYGLNPFTDIISHKEGNARGIASNHSDPEHYWVNTNYTMDGFRADVAAELSVIDATHGAPETDKYYPGMLFKYSGDVYKTPPEYSTTAPNGTYTITEVKNIHGIMWGRLKSGAGWIPLGEV